MGLRLIKGELCIFYINIKGPESDSDPFFVWVESLKFCFHRLHRQKPWDRVPTRRLTLLSCHNKSKQKRARPDSTLYPHSHRLKSADTKTRPPSLALICPQTVRAD